MKRFFDIISSLIVLLIGLPFFLLLALAIVIDSRGGIFYRQIRVGRNEKDFYLYKFRSMVSNADKKGQLTVGASDSRITRVGKFIRKFKLDEFPQLINVIKGEMSIVGPRPEVPKYVKMYNNEQRKVLSVRPGLTDYASLEYINENEILGKAENPEQLYIQEIMPAKLELNLRYIAEKSLLTDLKIIFRTIGRIFK
ncbi:MAG TPA: sugar transferase [Flavobacteriales bacterium]|nr:glycosyl transferase [Flavobacteriales bacterium]HRE74835.1 sugar transferase [Flavobacteriales bacterium]HRE97902.1 sugar transferase [Flavobacteriales bacterium]HRJ34683.1 sugar transferase [Flavobacteriales bacterium]HRJ37941.1 sugar transferase [Flavobacteriales bacterium]